MSRLRSLPLELGCRFRTPTAGGHLSTTNLLTLTVDPDLSSLRLSHSDRPRFKYFPNRDLHPPESFENVVMPERHRLPIMPKTPSMWSSGIMRPPKQTKVRRGGVTVQ